MYNLWFPFTWSFIKHRSLSDYNVSSSTHDRARQVCKEFSRGMWEMLFPSQEKILRFWKYFQPWITTRCQKLPPPPINIPKSIWVLVNWKVGFDIWKKTHLLSFWFQRNKIFSGRKPHIMLKNSKLGPEICQPFKWTIKTIKQKVWHLLLNSVIKYRDKSELM